VTTDWPSVSPEASGFEPDLADRLDMAIGDGRIVDLHGLVVVRKGALVLEHYGSGEDFKWNESLGRVTFEAATLHDIRSVSKSVTTLLYGIALEHGRVPGPATRLIDALPEYAAVAAEGWAALTVEHALTMTLGIDWNEDLPYTSPDNSEIAMELAPDRYRYLVERPVVEEPGRTWHYCGGATALVGRLVEAGTGRRLDEYAAEVLLRPLGIERFEWMTGADGVPSAASGLRMAPRDLARIGQLVLSDGSWEGRQIVPQAWLEEALTPHVSIAPAFDYGYQWYLGETTLADRPARRVAWVAGIGNGGQRLFVFREFDLVVVIAAGAYNSADQSATPTAIIDDVLVPALKS
jgi:CubicO group peptidase (beta-lactamase class C family)